MRIEKLPFYWRLKEKGSPNIVPDHAPFEFDFVEDLQLIIEKKDPKTWNYLETIYRADYNIGFLQDGYDIARGYGVDFIDFINRSLFTYGSHVKSILEVGCGDCVLLEEFRNKGYDVVGVDPSPIAIRGGKKRNIQVVPEFFPTEKYSKKVDLIFHIHVQEHVPDPVKFLREQKKQLTENGLVIIAVPDANEGIESGDFSMAMHQHLSYFDSESIKNTAEAAGLEVLEVEIAKYGGSLYCLARNKPDDDYKPKKGIKKFEEFCEKIELNKESVTEELQMALSNKNAQVGFYVPLRTLPYISLLGRYKGFRFFDDTNHWYNRAFDGTEIYIENFNDLKKNPVTDLYIMSLTFADTIKKKIEAEIPGIRIKTLKDILATYQLA
jgi:SAM-dependent methyltransferase